MSAMKEAASNTAASAKAGYEKAQASAEEVAEKMRTRDPYQKEMIREEKEAKKAESEMKKEDARQQNAAARQAGAGFTTGNS